MSRNDGRLEPGQPLRGAISARAWNRMMDASDIVHGDQFSQSATGPQNGKTPYTWVYCKPNVTVQRWGVLAIDGMEFEPTSSSGGATAQFEEMPVLLGITPSATTTAWCVAVEPIEYGKIGKVAVGGVVQCKVEIVNTSHRFVACKASSAELKSGTAGEGLILWKEGGTGSNKWALVRLAAGGEKSIKRVTFTGVWSRGTTAIVTDAVSPGVTYGAKNYLATINNGTTCYIDWVNNEWVLIAWDWHGLSGYDPTNRQQVLTHDGEGGFAWVNTVICT